jgi:hypothetical protein
VIVFALVRHVTKSFLGFNVRLFVQVGGGIRVKNDYLCVDCWAVFSADRLDNSEKDALVRVLGGSERPSHGSLGPKTVHLLL